MGSKFYETSVYLSTWLEEVITSEPGRDTYTVVYIPPEFYTDDSTVAVSVTKQEEPVAVLNEIYVFGVRRTTGGPMGEEISRVFPWKLHCEGCIFLRLVKDKVQKTKKVIWLR